MVESADDKRKKDFINGFIIPNTKEEVMQFIMLAANKVSGEKSGGLSALAGGLGGAAEQKKWADVWTAKCKQAYTQAQIICGSDKETMARIEKILKDAKIKV